MPKKKDVRKQPKPNLPQLAETVIGQLRLKNVRIVETKSKLEVHGSVNPSEFQVTTQIEVGVTENPKILLGTVTVTVQTPPQEEGADPRSSLLILVAVQCIFESQSPLPDGSDVSQRERNALHQSAQNIAWPYIRAYVQMMAASMGLAPLILPILFIQAFVPVSSDAAAPPQKASDGE